MTDEITGEAAARKRSGARKRRRGPMVATPETLERAAQAHLARYAASAEHLRRLLLARVARSAWVHGTDRAAGAAAVEALIARLSARGHLDDAAYAQALARSLNRRGRSLAGIRAKLRAKGVGADETDAALTALKSEASDPDLAAALALARRKRLGPYRPAAERAARRAKDLAAFGRQGFDFDLARRVVDAEDLAQLEEEAGQAG